MDSDRLNAMLPLFQVIFSDVFVGNTIQSFYYSIQPHGVGDVSNDRATYSELLSYVFHDASWLLGQLRVQLAIDPQKDIVKNATRKEDVVNVFFL